jgi:molecular chaperone DnaK (HSP70)
MGDRSQIYRVGGKTLTPLDIGSMILKRLVECAEKELGQPIRDVVITVPAYFTEAQKEDTKRAGEKAGLNVLKLIPEPTAAAIAYGFDKGKDQTLMVYDLGGGTFDVSILTVQQNEFKVKAVGGDSCLGGDDFDEAIMFWASSQFQAKTGIDLLNNSSRKGKIARQRLKEAAEVAKIELSQAETALIEISDCLGHPLELELSLSQYNKLIEPLLQKTIQCMRDALRDAGMSAGDIDRVILVGGSTRNRAVREIVSQEIKDPFTADRVDEVVAHGAAIVAASIVDNLPVEVTDVTPHTYGVDMLQENNGEEELVFVAVIPRQTPYPCQYGRFATTSRPWQERVRVSVFRGEHPDPQKNTQLGQLILPITPQSEEVPLGVIFNLDADGILKFTMVELPRSEVITPILEYAAENGGALHITLVNQLINT